MTSPMVTAPTGSSLQRLAELSWDRVAGQSVLWYEGTAHGGLELAGRIRRVAGGLRAAGVRPGDRVVVCMANCPEVPVTYHAIWRAGAVATPVLFLLSEDELRHVLADSAAVAVVTTPEFVPKVSAAAAGLGTARVVVIVGEVPAGDSVVPFISFAELEQADPAGLIGSDPSSLAALLYTGGTTGRSKGVMISHDALSASAWAATSTSYTGAASCGLLPLPLSHVYGLMVSVMSLHAPDPGTTVLMRWFDAPGWLALAQQHRVTISAVVPTMLQLLLGQPLEDYDLSALIRLSSGSAPLPPPVTEELARRLPGVEIGEGYGCTETAAIISTSPVGQVRPGSVGRPAPGVHVRIERPDGSVAGPGEDGEICVRGPVLMTGYWHAEAETERVMRGDWLHTGDVGRLDGDGYLFVVDRIKDLIIRGGYNVYPRDVEEALAQHPDVIAAAVVGRPDPVYGEEVVAFVQRRPGGAASEADLIEYAKSRLSAVKYPREIRFIDTIPLTSVLKVDRKRLRATLASG